MSPVDFLVFGPCCWYFEVLFSTFGYLMKIYCRLEEDWETIASPASHTNCSSVGAGADVGALVLVLMLVHSHQVHLLFDKLYLS